MIMVKVLVRFRHKNILVRVWQKSWFGLKYLDGYGLGNIVVWLKNNTLLRSGEVHCYGYNNNHLVKFREWPQS